MDHFCHSQEDDGRAWVDDKRQNLRRYDVGLNTDAGELYGAPGALGG